MYRTIVRFKDLQDGGYTYNVGDIFPRNGLAVGDNRISELSTNKNRRGIPLIELVPEATERPSEPLEDPNPMKTPGTGAKARKRPRKAKEKIDVGADS